jgi:hypothetical protein
MKSSYNILCFYVCFETRSHRGVNYDVSWCTLQDFYPKLQDFYPNREMVQA